MKNMLLPLFLLLCATVQGQEVQLNEDPDVAALVQAWTNGNRTNPGINGWRLQVMASPDRQQVEAAEQRFKTLYPDVPASWVHEKPYYKLRVGAFRSRLEAQAFLPVISTDFPGAYPAKDPAIHPRDFLRQ
jgi:hypothetical protein